MRERIVDALRWRNATKSFDPNRGVNDIDLDTLLQVLRFTPSSYGLQPWKFVVVGDQDTKKELFGASYGQEQVLSGSHIIVLCARTNINSKDIERYLIKIAEVRNVEISTLEDYRKIMTASIESMNTVQLHHWLSLQCYIALGFLLFACSLLQIDACPMEGFVAEEYDRILKLKGKGLTSVVVCPIGYRLPNDTHNFQKKVRYDLSELVICV